MIKKAQRAMAALLAFPCAMLMAQTQPPPPVQSQPAQTTQILSPDQLDDLVAPIALYPDPLLGQVLAASTYPLEVVEAQQWLQQNSNLHGSQLMDAARQQNWDASVQALVAFPTVLTMLNRDVRWTTDLGNAFLAQQEDVMHAVQRMRVRAQQKGRLSSTAQQTVTTETQGGQQAVVIEPADPQVVYVPVYNPEYVWGPPAWGYYPPLWYPSIGYGFGFGPGIFLGGYFPSWGGFGWGGWGSAWGWGCGWFGGGLYVNNFFFNHYGFHNYYGGYGGYRGGFGGRFAGVGRGAWQHDPYHRAGIAYGNRGVASRFNNQRFAAGRFSRGFSGTRGYAGGGSRGFNGGGSSGRGFAGNRAGSSGYSGSGRTQAGQGYSRGNYAGQSYNRGNYSSPGYGRSNPSQGYRGFSGANAGGGSRGYSAPRSYSTPRSYSGGGRSFSGGGFSSGRSFGGGGRSFGGGGRSFGGGGRSFGGGGGGHSFGGGGHGGGGGHAGGGGHGGGRR